MELTLCSAEAIPEDGAIGFTVSGARLFAVKEHGTIYIYLNRCPHLGIPLEWQENQFLDRDGKLIQCSTHGALFERSTGECLQGPCRGEYLWQISSRTEKGMVLIDQAELPEPDRQG